MRKIIPNNNVKINYHEILECFIELIKQRQRDNIKSIFLTGSYARGDANDLSDLDVWCVFEHLDAKVLYDVGAVTRELPVPYEKIEINSQCFSINEVYSKSFSSWIEEPVKVLDAVLLYGQDLFNNNASVSELKLIYKKYLADILMSIRHYICVDEAVEKLTYQKIRNYVLKPLMFPLRLERYCFLGYYPQTNYDLLKSYDNKVSEMVEYFLDKEKFDKDISINHKEVLSKMHDVVLELLNS